MVCATLCLLILGACQNIQEEQAVETSTSMSQEIKISSLDELKSEMAKLSKLEWGETLFETNSPLEQKQSRYEIKLKDLSLRYASSTNQDLPSLHKKGGKQGAVLLLELELYNPSSQDLYFPIESFELTESNAVTKYLPNSPLIPSDEVDLLSQLQSQNRLVKSGDRISGYLTYALDSEGVENFLSQGAAYLDILPPTTNADAIIGLTDTTQDVSFPFYLPLNREMELALQENALRIQDRLSAEFWGEKTLLAQGQDLKEENQEKITLRVKGIELTNLDLFEAFEESFQYFPNGQVILSVEMEIDNQSDYDVLPVDATLSAMINGDMIQSDYALITQVYGEKIPAKSKGKIIKAFALDRGTYEARWQDQEIQFAYSLLAENTDTMSESASVTTEVSGDDVMTQEETNSTISVAQFNFAWKPILLSWITSEYDLITVEEKNRLEVESSSDQDQSTTEETSISGGE